jgi:hypothetical protein
VWLGAVLVPLCFGGQKQFHYLFPAMPAFALLSGWVIEQTIDRGFRQWELGRKLVVGTVVVVLCASLGLPLIGWKMRGSPLPIDWFTMTVCAVGAAVPLVMMARKSDFAAVTFAFAIAAAVGMTVLIQSWSPSLRSSNPRDVADAVRAVGSGPYYFYGDNVSLPLLFYMGAR